MLTNEKKTLEIQVKNLMSDLEYSNSQLPAFSSSSEKLDNILGMGKTRNKGTRVLRKRVLVLLRSHLSLPLTSRNIRLTPILRIHDLLDRDLLDSVGPIDLRIDVSVHITLVLGLSQPAFTTVS